MAPQTRDLIQCLSSESNEAKLKAVRSLKNEIIGSQYKKRRYLELGAVPRIVQILASPQENKLTVQAAATLGSFAYHNDEGVAAVVDNCGIGHLLKTLSSDDEKVVEAGVRSLKMIFQSNAAPRDAIFNHASFDRLVALLNHSKKAFAEDAAIILAKCCWTQQHQDKLMAYGALQGMTRLLITQTPNRQAAGLEALVSMSNENAQVCDALLAIPGSKTTLLTFTRHPDARLRLMASSVLTNVERTLHSETTQVLTFREQKHILQVLVKLLNEPSAQLHVPDVLASLMDGRKDLQRAAFDVGAAKHLCGFLTVEKTTSPDFKTGILRALAITSHHLPECRHQIVDCHAIKEIIDCLQSTTNSVRAAAAFCIQNMTATVKDLKYDWVVDSVPRLISLLHDVDMDVKINACAAFCNLLYEITKAKNACIDECLGTLVDMTQSPEPRLVHYAAWAFKNLTHQLPNDRWHLVMKGFSWKHVKSLIYNSDSAIQHSALRFVQNVCSSDTTNIQLVVEWSQGELLDVISDKLSDIEACHPDVVTAALRVISNISTGCSEHQNAIIESGVASLLLPCMRDMRSETIRAAAVFCIINLIWRDELPLANEGGDDERRRATSLREMGIEAELKKMQSDESLDVRERVRTAIGFFRN